MLGGGGETPSIAESCAADDSPLRFAGLSATTLQAHPLFGAAQTPIALADDGVVVGEAGALWNEARFAVCGGQTFDEPTTPLLDPRTVAELAVAAADAAGVLVERRSSKRARQKGGERSFGLSCDWGPLPRLLLPRLLRFPAAPRNALLLHCRALRRHSLRSVKLRWATPAAEQLWLRETTEKSTKSPQPATI